MKYWRKYNGAIISDVPPHIDMTNTEEQVCSLIKENKVLFARWQSDFDCNQKTGFWFVINDMPMELNDYDIKTRNKIRKGLKECDVKPITKNDLVDYGYEVYFSAFNNYKTYLKAKTKKEYIQEIIITPDFWEYWGVFNNNKLIAYCKVMIAGNYAEYRSTKFHPDFLKCRPSEALIYTMNRNYLNDRNFNYVNNGARSISHTTNFPDFLIRKFKFRKAYCRLNIKYNIYFGIIIKIIYPFMSLFRLVNFGIFRQINILLQQESIYRSFK